MVNDGVEADAKRLLVVLADKEGARKGEPIAVGPEDAEAAGLGAEPYGGRSDRAVWRLIAKGALEVVMESGASSGEDPEPGAVYRLTGVGLEEAREG